ncbi:MAG: hypothetical protein GYA24_17520, partial [Candidatus Lokiarchaeota archaeon]|nr:hypothetical protein [Candidatus Lokiarchaeota archaeon]
MKSSIKCSLFLGMFLLSVLALSSTSAAIEPAAVQWNTTPSLPGESVLDDLLGRAGGVLYGVQNANVTG